MPDEDYSQTPKELDALETIAMTQDRLVTRDLASGELALCARGSLSRNRAAMSRKGAS